MKYKAIVFDLDGTAVPNSPTGMPSKHLIEVVPKIKNEIFISAATGRAITNCRYILKELGLTTPCIVNGGTKIVDPITDKIIWQKMLDIKQVHAITKIARQYHYSVYFSDDAFGNPGSPARAIKGPENIIYIEPVTIKDVPEILEKLKKIKGIAAYTTRSYEPEHLDIHITHKEATKKHSVEILLDLLKVKKEEVIGLGDGNNDLPIFEAVGYRVAMSTGSEELKKVADLVIPNEDDNGVARAIEKLIMI